MAHALLPKKIFDTESILVKTLKTNNETLQNINVHFLDIYQRFRIHMVHEMVKTDLKGTKALIVDQNSAGPLLPDVTYYGIEATHSGMCKFQSKYSPGYLNISTTVKTWIGECPNLIRSRWELERKMRLQVQQAEAREIMKIFDVSCALSPRAFHTLTQQTPNQSSTTSNPPGMLQRDPPRPEAEQRRSAMLEAPQARPRFEYETAEVEEREDAEMVDR